MSKVKNELKRTAFFILLITIRVICPGQSTRAPIQLEVQDLPLQQVLDSISTRSGFNFSYNSMLIPPGSLYSFQSDGLTIDELMRTVLRGTGITYHIDKDQIILKPVPTDVETDPGKLTFSINGSVLNKISGEVIEDVIVYLDGTSLVGITNTNGYFRIDEVPFGSYKIVFSHTSFETRIYEFNKNTPGILSISTELITHQNVLKEVEVLANPIKLSPERRANMESFLDQFLGRSHNALECQILNPEVLQFIKGTQRDELMAEAADPLMIQNKALGYLLFCDLESFTSTDKDVKFIGQLRFEQLTPENNRERRRWKKNRKMAYEGSMREFFRSVIEGKSHRRGFRAFYIRDISQVNSRNLHEADLDSLLLETDIPAVYQLNLESILYVSYTKELESEEYLIDMETDILRGIAFNSNRLLFLNRKPDLQKSLIDVPEEPAFIDRNGNLINPASISVSGYWSWERIADLVPINYDPKREM